MKRPCKENKEKNVCIVKCKKLHIQTQSFDYNKCTMRGWILNLSKKETNNELQSSY